MSFTFKKATKSAAKLRLGLTGPSGSGKTFTALAVGTNLGKKVAVIDTERGSASLYADRFGFDALDLPNLEPETYMEAIAAAGKAGYDVLLVDSFSHAWERLKDRVDSIAKAKYRGNSWSAWAELTPIQNQLVEAILQYPGHVICTLRTKTAWETEKDERTGKAKPVKVGLAPIQREGVDYEFTIILELSEGGLAKVGKTRWSAISDKVFVKPGEDFAKSLLGWLNTSEGATAANEIDPVAKKRAELEQRAVKLPLARCEKFIALVRAAKDAQELDKLGYKLGVALEQAAEHPFVSSGTVPVEVPAAPHDAVVELPRPATVAGELPAGSTSASLADAMGVPAEHPLGAEEHARGNSAGPAPVAAPASTTSSRSEAPGAATVAPGATPKGFSIPDGTPCTRAELAAWIGDEATSFGQALDELVELLGANKEACAATSRFAGVLARRHRADWVERMWRESGGQTANDTKGRRQFVPMGGPAWTQFVYGSLRSVVHAAESPLGIALKRALEEAEKAQLVAGAIGNGKDF